MPHVSALDEDVLITEYPRHASVGLSDVKEEYEKRWKLKNTPHLLLVKLHGLAIFDQDAQSFLASKEQAAITKAAAILFDTEAGYYEHGKRLIEIFTEVNVLKFPIELFENENDALSWLRSYR